MPSEIENRVTVREETALDRPTDLLSIIMQVVQDPRMDIDKMEKLLAMQERVIADQRRQAFILATARVQAKVPQINKEGRIVVKGQERSRYARLEDIDAAVRPLLAEEGLAFSFDTESQDGKLFKISCKLSHKDGHSETKAIMLPMDSSDYRSNVQSIGSTVSYGKRQLIKMHLNIIETDEDDDGNGGAQAITDDEVKDLETMIDDSRADMGKFLQFMGVDSLGQILRRDLAKAVNALETKKRGNR